MNYLTPSEKKLWWDGYWFGCIITMTVLALVELIAR